MNSKIYRRPARVDVCITDSDGGHLADARDAVWNHPDLMPSADDLDDPASFIDRVIGGDVSSADVDALIAEIEKDAEGPDGS